MFLYPISGTLLKSYQQVIQFLSFHNQFIFIRCQVPKTRVQLTVSPVLRFPNTSNAVLIQIWVVRKVSIIIIVKLKGEINSPDERVLNSCEYTNV